MNSRHDEEGEIEMEEGQMQENAESEQAEHEWDDESKEDADYISKELFNVYY